MRGIFTRKDDELIHENIKTLFNKMLRYHNLDSGITLQDIFEGFVRGEHREVALAAPKVLGLNPSYRYISPPIDGEVLYINFQEANWYYPDRRKLNEGAALHDKLYRWKQGRMQLSKEWGLVKAVYNKLDEVCTRQQYVRNYWPPIVTFLGNSDTVAKIAEYKVASNITPIPVELRKACEETMHTVTTACLLPEPEKVKIYPEMSTINVKRHPCPWGGAYNAM